MVLPQCCAEVDGEGLSLCAFCGRSFDPFSLHLELPKPDGGGWLVVCGPCVPDFIRFAEVEGPPGAAVWIREVWSS